MQTSKYSSPYALVKDPIEQTKVYSLYDARNKATGEMWLAKVLDNKVITELSMDDHVSYNEQVLQNLKEKEHVIYLSQIFIKKEKTFIIHEKFQTRLSNYLQKQVTLKAGEVQKILKDVYQGMCDIYEQRYVHANLRSEHIVRVAGDGPDQKIWKIQTLVLNSDMFPIETLFTWKQSTASPQDKKKQREMDDEMLDAQIVWNIGYLAVQMLLGSFIMKKMLKDSDVQWNRLRELTDGYPQLYQLINGCFRFNFKDRIPLKRFLDLTLFQDVARLGIADFFMTASKVFKTSTCSSFLNSVNLRTMSRNGKSTNMKSGILKSKMMNKPKAHVYFDKIEEVKEEIYDEQGTKDISRYCFLVNANNFITSIVSSSENASKMNQNRVIIEYFMLKLAGKIQQQVNKSRIFDERVAKMREDYCSKLNNNTKVIKLIKQKENTLIQKYQLDLKKLYSTEELVVICNQVINFLSSYVVTLIQDSEKNVNQAKISLNLGQWYTSALLPTL